MTTARARAPINAALAGKTYGTSVHRVTSEAIEAYARATNDLNERYLRGADSVASPVWPVVPAFPFFMAAARDPELGVDLRRLLHAGEEHLLHKPVRPGDALVSTGELESVEHGSNGDAFTVVVTMRDEEGGLVAEVKGTLFVRGAGRAAASDDHPRGEVVHESRVAVDDDQMERYAAASGDRNPIHLDRLAARRAGLRTPILHGMCTMAMATKGAVDGLASAAPERVARVAVTFARPVVPGQTLTTRWHEAQGRAGSARYGFETIAEDGAPVITGGEVELRD